ncbi:hypothetical protein DFH09DRAFT_1099736 [Mycena vulgaris]|nr:hypothetical protein DFH09DRAFT_1099736 [Mycena vulgaris]
MSIVRAHARSTLSAFLRARPPRPAAASSARAGCAAGAYGSRGGSRHAFPCSDAKRRRSSNTEPARQQRQSRVRQVVRAHAAPCAWSWPVSLEPLARSSAGIDRASAPSHTAESAAACCRRAPSALIAPSAHIASRASATSCALDSGGIWASAMRDAGIVLAEDSAASWAKSVKNEISFSASG